MSTTRYLSLAPSFMPKPYLQIHHLSKAFGTFLALSDISLEIEEGEFVCFLGPSGCGKTTLLRCIAGLEEQSSGQIIQAGLDISWLPPARRDFGIVFQSYALFPNLTAEKNIAYGLENQKLPKTEVRHKVQELLNLVGLADMGHQYPAQLSGGQQQRIALARALALSPGMLLLDEPLSALDARVRASLRSEVAQLQRRLGVTTIMVTHDQEEALTMADRIVVMNEGQIEQVGTPHEIYGRPDTPFVANFIGVMNFLSGVTTADPHQVRCGDFLLTIEKNGLPPNTPIKLAIRPEDVVVNGRSPNSLTVTIETIEFLGSFYRLHLALPDHTPLISDLAASHARFFNWAEQHTLSVELPAAHLQLFHD